MSGRGPKGWKVELEMRYHELQRPGHSPSDHGATRCPMPLTATTGERELIATVAETAKLFRISQATVRRLAAAGELPVRKVGRQWRSATWPCGPPHTIANEE